jgi:hypothetical protein
MVQQADTGCDFDFLETSFGFDQQTTFTESERHSHAPQPRRRCTSSRTTFTLCTPCSSGLRNQV